MAYKNNTYAQRSGPQQDTGWGLIYRLNKLYNDIEYAVETANFERWNFKMDRIFCNICYKEDMALTFKNNKEIKKIELTIADTKVFRWFNKQIAMLQENIKRRKGHGPTLKTELYDLLLRKDIWLRKLIFKLGLYLREVENDPRRAIYGG